MDQPSLFIGSSTEGLPFAQAVRRRLEHDVEVTIWNEGFFALGATVIETLVNLLPRFDFAVLVLTPDDLINSRDTAAFGPRDNVVFELGLFMGRLGRSRTFLLHQANAKLKIPSDLSGVTTATYLWPRADENYDSAVGAACDQMRNAIRDLGFSERKASKRIHALSERQARAEARIEQAEHRIDRIFAYTMAESMFENLSKLATGRFGPYKAKGGLRRELRHLRDIGYVRVQGHIGDLPKEGENLSEFVTVTEVGKEFVRLRESMTGVGDDPGE